MPELDPKRDHPPRVRCSREALPEYPNSNKHDNGVAVMKRFGFNQPRVVQATKSQGLGPWPVHYINLVRLHQMFRPMREHDNHEKLQSALVPLGIQLLV